MSPRRRSRPLWARVTIHLNLLQMGEATNAATTAHRLKRLPPGLTMINGTVTGSIDIPVGWCYLNPRSRLAVVNQDVWEEYDAPMFSFCSRQLSGRTEPAFVWYDVRDWAMSRDLDRLSRG